MQLLAASAFAQRNDARPNIIFIVADDLGYADLSGYGRKEYLTPALDRLATEGVRFSQAYAAAPVCTPSRTAFMTGRYPARTRVGLWEPLTGQESDRTIGLPVEHPTVSSLLSTSGYETALIGKWHLGPQPEHHPNRHGFGEFFGVVEGYADYSSHEPGLFRNTDRIEREGYLTDLFTEEAISFITRPHAHPFFLSLQYTAPHWPWQGPGDPPHADTSDMRSGGSMEVYARMVRRLDEGVGEILDALEEHGLENSTLVIFTSDNGGDRYSSMGPFSGGKMQLWEGGIREPAMIRWPGVVPAGRQTDQVAVTMDWTAAILAAAHVEPDPAVPAGRHRPAPHFQGSNASPAPHAGVEDVSADQPQGVAQWGLEIPGRWGAGVPVQLGG